MKTHHRLDVTLTLLGPILTRGATAAPGIDAPMARDGLGRFMLPYSLVKGKVLDAFRDLRPNDPAVQDWLGRSSGDANRNYDPERGRLRFSDFVTDQAGTPGGVIERIQIDPDTGATAGRMLAMVEAPFGYGEPVPFAGRIEFIADAAEAKAIEAALDAALRWVPAYGALRTVGFGRTEKVGTDLQPEPKSSAGTPPPGASLPVRLTLDRPLCLVGPKHSRNHFESLDCIPGAVLKGAAARLLLELNGAGAKFIDPSAPTPLFPQVWKHFEVIRFAEARPMPVAADERPVVPPLSLVVQGEWFDVALEAGPRLIGGAAPAFAPDWKPKDEALVRQAFGWAKLPRERRTRTSIDAATGRAADQLLFSYGLVLPEALIDGAKASFVWETVIGLEGVPEPERAVVAAELADLFAHGLPNIGKTRAVAAVTWLPKSTPPKVTDDVPLGNGIHVVTLQTDFLMTDPTTLQDTTKSLHDAYAEFWHEASGGSLELVRYFARQSLHGGYLARRFGRKSYEPYLVTDRGSVFVLTVNDPATAANRLTGWKDGGLPLPSWAEKRYGTADEPLWKTCPFLPHVGFGEVAIDLECHTNRRPEGPS